MPFTMCVIAGITLCATLTLLLVIQHSHGDDMHDTRPQYIPKFEIPTDANFSTRGSTWEAPSRIKSSELQKLYSYRPLLELLDQWNPDEPTVSDKYRNMIPMLDFSDEEERKIATELRELELPFKVHSIPLFDRVAEKWTVEFLNETFKVTSDTVPTGVRYTIERSENNHFLYWSPKTYKKTVRKQAQQHLKGNRAAEGGPTSLPTPPSYTPPTFHERRMKWEDWIDRALTADTPPYIGPDDPHYYLTLGTAPSSSSVLSTKVGEKFPHVNKFVSDDLRVFSTSRSNFFMPEARFNKGIQCRFGMRGVVAEAHYDVGRNFIAMLKGAKRYVLAPPSECSRVGTIRTRDHPSFRHSGIDWSNLETAYRNGFGDVRAMETVLKAGEVLYVPSYWFHYIVSLNFSVQCNSRSGPPPDHEGEEEIVQCLGKDTFEKGLHTAKADKHIALDEKDRQIQELREKLRQQQEQKHQRGLARSRRRRTRRGR